MTYKRNRGIRKRLTQTIQDTLQGYKRFRDSGRHLARAMTTLEELIREHNDGADTSTNERVVRTADGHWTTLGMARENGAELDRGHWTVGDDIDDAYLPVTRPASSPTIPEGKVLSEGVISRDGRLHLTK